MRLRLLTSAIAATSLLAGLVAHSAGDAVPKERLPSLYPYLETVLEKLGRAQQAVNNRDPRNTKIEKVVNELEIVYSDAPNAYVRTGGNRNGTQVNHVTVTTELLKRLVKNREDLKKIDGVLAHEIAHPLDDYSHRSFSDSWGSSQAQEVRADTEAILLLKEAKLAPESLYDALVAIGAFEKNSKKTNRTEKAKSAAISSHPESRAREAINRMVLTVDRYENGESPIEPVERPVNVEELGNLTESESLSKKSQFKRPESLEENLTRLEKVLGDSSLANNLTTYDWFLLECLDKSLGSAPALSQDQLRLVARLNYAVAQKIPRNEPWDWPKKRIEETPFYRSEPYLEAVRSELGKQVGKPSPPAFVRDAGFVVPKDLIYPTLRNQWNELLRTLPLDADLIDLAGKFDPASNAEASLTLYERISKLPLNEQIHFFSKGYSTAPRVDETDGNLEGFSPPHRASYWSNTRYDSEVKEAKVKWRKKNAKKTTATRVIDVNDLPGIRKRGAATPAPGETPDPPQNRAIAEHIWRNRGSYALMDVSIGEGREIDWDFVFRELKINPDDGYKEIRKAVTDFVRSTDPSSLKDPSASWTHPNASSKPLQWLDRPTFDQILADLHGDTKVAFKHKLLMRAPEIFRSIYSEELNRLLSENPLPENLRDLKDIHRRVLLDIFGKFDKPSDTELAAREAREAMAQVFDIQALALERSPQDVKFKKEQLEKYFLTAVPTLSAKSYENLDWIHAIWNADDRLRSVTGVLLRTKLLDRPSDLYVRQPELAQSKRSKVPFLRALQRSLEEELQADTSLDALKVTSERIFGHLAEDRSFSSPVLALKDAAVRRLEALPGSADRKFELFRVITSGGGTVATDKFFKTHFLNSELFKPPRLATAEELVKKKAVSNFKLRLQIAGPIVKASEGTLENQLKLLDELVPDGSLAKDELLEEIAWGKNASRQQVGQIEERKSYNWTKIKPETINKISLMSEYIQDLDQPTRNELIRYIHAPEKEMPDELREAILHRVEEDVASERKLVRMLGFENEVGSAPQRALADFEDTVQSLSPRERIPIYDLVFHSGLDPIADRPDFVDFATTSYLGYTPEKSRYLYAFLQSIPPHEVSPTLAYLMSLPPGEDDGLKAVFAAFKSVGAKAGQGAHTWSLLGNRSEELRGLKDHAPPMTMNEIQEVMDSELSPSERKRVKRLKSVLGSASMKTVVEVELKGGETAVMAVQNPKAEAQVRSNLAFAKRFMQNLQRDGLVTETPLIKSFIATLERQMGRELDLSGEPATLRRAQQVLEGKFGAWEVRVPSPVGGFRPHSHIVLMAKARGVPFDQLPDSVKPAVGGAIVESSLRGLFKHGFFDADRHVGNQLIDADTKTIWMIDFGQAEQLKTAPPWREDDRSTLSEFAYALSRKDAGDVLKQALRMSDGPPPGGAALEKLKGEITSTLDETDPKLVREMVPRLMNSFADHEVILSDRFSAGVLKGIMTLYAENYVKPEVFNEILGRNVEAALRSKGPMFLKRAYDEGGFARCKALLLNFLRTEK